MKKKVICWRHIRYGWTRRNTDLTKPNEICNCDDIDEMACKEKRTCRPIKITYQFIKRIPIK